MDHIDPCHPKSPEATLPRAPKVRDGQGPMAVVVDQGNRKLPAQCLIVRFPVEERVRGSSKRIEFGRCCWRYSLDLFQYIGPNRRRIDRLALAMPSFPYEPSLQTHPSAWDRRETALHCKVWGRVPAAKGWEKASRPMCWNCPIPNNQPRNHGCMLYPKHLLSLSSRCSFSSTSCFWLGVHFDLSPALPRGLKNYLFVGS